MNRCPKFNKSPNLVTLNEMHPKRTNASLLTPHLITPSILMWRKHVLLTIAPWEAETDLFVSTVTNLSQCLRRVPVIWNIESSRQILQDGDGFENRKSIVLDRRKCEEWIDPAKLWNDKLISSGVCKPELHPDQQIIKCVHWTRSDYTANLTQLEGDGCVLPINWRFSNFLQGTAPLPFCSWFQKSERRQVQLIEYETEFTCSFMLRLGDPELHELEGNFVHLAEDDDGSWRLGHQVREDLKIRHSREPEFQLLMIGNF